MPLSFIKIAVGVILLCMGRRLFWLFVGAVGFVVASEMVAAMLAHEPQMVRLVIAALVGLVGALIAIYVQKLAVTLAGFLAGGYFFMTLLDAWALHSPERSWIAFAVGGIIGAILMMAVFDWTLMIFSSITGAHLIIHSFHMDHTMASVLFVILCVFGVLFQSRLARPVARGR